MAQRLFMSLGYAETPVQTIIDEVGVAKGSFYHHYPSALFANARPTPRR